MRIIFTLITVYLINTPLFSQCVDNANVYTFTYNGTTYEVVKELKTWADASLCAVERNGYLVEINDLAEQNAVYSAIVGGAGVSSTYTSIANGGGIAYVWIGATDQQTEGTWLWDGDNDNTGINFWTGEGDNGANNGASAGGAYFNWGGTSNGTPHEPDDFGMGQDHGAIGLAGWPSGTTNLGIAGEWNDIIGTSQLYFVVEKNSSAGIHDNGSDTEGEIKIHPNPTHGPLYIDGDYTLVEIYNGNGQLLHQFSNSEVIDISALENTIYFVRIIGDSMVTTARIILN